MMSEERAQKFHTDDTTLIWEVLLIGRSKFVAYQKHYIYLDQYYNICMEVLHLFLGLHKETTLLGGVAKCWLFSLWLKPNVRVFLFYFQLTNAAGYTAVYITVNVSYINLMFFMCLRCSLTSHMLLFLSLLFPLSSCHSPT